MQRVNRSSAVATLPAAPAGGTPGYFAAGNPGIGQPATVPGYEWFNAVQEELLAALQDGGLTASAADLTQLRQAIRRGTAKQVSNKSANATLTLDETGLVLVSAASANVTLTLPAANAMGGRAIAYHIVRTDASANTVTIARDGSDTIEGATSIAVGVGDRVTLASDGAAAWRRLAAVTGRLIAVRVFTASGTYTPTPGTQTARVRAIGGGGGGAGGTLPSVGNVSLGSPGGSASYGEALFTAAQIGASQVVTIGAGGTAAAGAAGGNGGTTSLGGLLSAPGGVGGAMLNNQTPPTVNGTGTYATAASGANLFAVRGGAAAISIAVSATAGQGAPGGNSPFGVGGPGSAANANGAAALNFGAGGAGALCNNGGGGSYSGGAGMPGIIIIEEYS
jgi:hypothetical protein